MIHTVHYKENYKVCHEDKLANSTQRTVTNYGLNVMLEKYWCSRAAL